MGLPSQPPEPEVTPACRLPRHCLPIRPRRATNDCWQRWRRCPTRAGCATRWPGVLALAVTATVAGCRSFAAIGQWAAETTADKLASLGLAGGGVPDESTLRKLFARLDADALDRALGVWMWTRTFTVDERRVIALDGKTIRGARTRPDGKAPHLLAAFDHGASAVLGQVAVDAKGDEIPAARTLLGQLDLDGAVGCVQQSGVRVGPDQDARRVVTE